MKFYEDYQSTCSRFGVPIDKQAEFEATVGLLISQSIEQTRTQQFVTAYLAQAVTFGVSESAVPDFALEHTRLHNAHQEELHNLLEAPVARMASERMAYTPLLGFGPPVWVGLAVGATVYLGVKHWYPGGWGGLKSDFMKYHPR